jgi:hypothetical protein
MTAGRLVLIVVSAAIAFGGCARVLSTPALPSRNNMVLDQLVIFSDSALPKHHRLLEELRTQRALVSTKLGLPTSDEPIHVYLFPTSDRLESYLRVHYPGLPKRRAFFVESDTRLTVYAYWGDRVAEDLRHEVAHGYLHSVVPNLPLWLDEGLAEYFEVARGQAGLNRAHLDHLTGETASFWQPDLKRLEQLHTTGEMTQDDYAQSWAWVHFLLESSPQRLQVLHNYLQSLAKSPHRAPLSESLRRADPQCEQNLIDHLAVLRQSLQ